MRGRCPYRHGCRPLCPPLTARPPAVQPKKVTESKYAAKDRADASVAAASANVDPNDPAAVARAQAEAEMRMFAGDLAAGGGGNELDTMQPKTKTEFEKYADTLVALYGTKHKDSKQYKLFVKQVAKGLCEAMDAEAIKDVETALAGVRSAKLKAAREAAAQGKKGARPRLPAPFLAVANKRPGLCAE